MRLVKTTQKHFIYQLTDKELKSPEVDNGYKFLAFSKSDYEDFKPNFKYDLGYEDYECDTLAEAIEFSTSK